MLSTVYIPTRAIGSTVHVALQVKNMKGLFGNCMHTNGFYLTGTQVILTCICVYVYLYVITPHLYPSLAVRGALGSE